MHTTKLIALKGDHRIALAFEKRQELINLFQKTKRRKRECYLRHPYATHILERGTNLRFIPKMLGHNSSKTTEIYTHVSTKSLQIIKSPFDDL